MVWFAYTANPTLATAQEVQCGSVFVTSKDTVQKIKSTILATHVKHKKSSKHALALGTSFGHVHSFLKDDLHLLQKLEDGPDQCLMLIKKPKSSAKQMLKSQSWSNLTSPSNSGIYHKTDEEDFRSKFKSKMRRKPSSDYRLAPVRDLSPPSNLSDDGGFLSHPPNNVNRWKRMDDSASDLSVSSGYKSLDRKDHGSFLRRSHQREEQNGYQHLRKDGRRYQSHSDIYFQSPKKLVTIQPEDDDCTIKSDEFYSESNSTQANTTLTSELDESKDQETVPRSHSLGDLSTGLTLSIVGQRKAESIQNLSLAGQKSLQKRTGYAKRKTDARSQGKSPKGSKGKQSIESQIQSIIQVGDESDVTSSTPEINGTSTQPIIYKSNSHSQLMKESSHNSLNNVQRALKADLLPDKHGINMAKTEREEDNSSDKSSQSTRSSVKTPNRPRRTLPVVPKGSEEVGDKKKKFSEMVKMRVSLHSSNSCSSVSRQSLLSPESESVSQTDSQTDTPSDKEVSELFNGHSSKTLRHNHFTDINTQDCQMINASGVPFNGNVHSSLPSSVRSCDSGQTTLRSCDSGQATLMSLSSTVDSGYLTTDAESDISSYTRSLQISAHNLYSSNKLNGYGQGGVPKQEMDRSFFNGHQRSPKQQPISRNNMYPSSNPPSMQPTSAVVQNHHSQPQMNRSFTAQVKSPTAERQVFYPNNVHSDKSHDVMRRNSASNMQSEKGGRYSLSLQNELNTQNVKHNAPKDANLNEKAPKMRPLSAQTSGIRIQDNTVSSTQQVLDNPQQHPPTMPMSAGHPVPKSAEHQYLVKTISSDNTARKDLMENFSPENYPSHSTPTSKGLSYSNTLPRSSNPYNQKVLGGSSSSAVKQFSSPQPVNFTGNSAVLDCDTHTLKSKYTSCQAGPVNQTQGNNSEVKYSSESSGLNNNNNTYVSTSMAAPASVNYNVQNKLTPKVFNHDYVNVQGREIRLGMNYDSVEPNPSDISNVYEEYHNGCQECIKQEFQSQGPLFPRNNQSDTVFVPQNVGAKVPSLFQLLQSYDLHPLYLKLCDNLPASDFITFSDCSIVLSNIKLDKRDAIAISTPQGKCATIGGPGSAFTPVKNAAVSTSSTFTMVTVASVTTHAGCDFEGIQKGDVVIEVNGATTMAIPAVSLKAAIQAQPGDIRLLVARPKEEKENEEKTMEQKNEEIDNLKKQLATMYMDLQKKNSVLQELTSQRTVTIKARKAEINGNIMSHEAILNALSEDEYIV